jgi:hypothetical protein
VAFVGGGFEAADVLLGGFKFAGEVLLREPGFFAECGNLQSYIPGFASSLKALSEVRVTELFLQKQIEVSLPHDAIPPLDFFEKPLHLLLKPRQVLLDDLPDARVIDHVVAVNQQIAKSDDVIMLGDASSSGRISAADAIKRFTDDLKVAFNG